LLGLNLGDSYSEFDVLATGDTGLAAAKRIQMSGAQTVGLAALLEIEALRGAAH
jgi:adenine/guanine phosphoribosyltransferase-like PRPP-binding protein